MPARQAQQTDITQLLLKTGSDGSPCFGYYFISDLVCDRPQGVPLHCVAVQANPVTGLILGYVEYFGIHRAVACLGRGYRGDAVKSIYSLDPRTGIELDLSVKLDFGATEVDAIYECQMDDLAARKSAFSAVFGPTLAAHYEEESLRVCKEALDYAWKNCGAMENDVITEERIRKMSRLFAELVMPFLIHNR